jgi:hypothetical protein
MADGENIDATVSFRLDDTDLVPGAALGNEAITEAAIGETPLYHSAQAKIQLDLDAGTLFLTAAEIKGGHPGITFPLPHILALDAALAKARSGLLLGEHTYKSSIMSTSFYVPRRGMRTSGSSSNDHETDLGTASSRWMTE